MAPRITPAWVRGVDRQQNRPMKNPKKNLQKKLEQKGTGTEQMKIPAKVRNEITKSFRKGEYDLDAIGLTDALEVPAIKNIVAVVTEAIEDQACMTMDDMAAGIVEAILKEFNWGFSNKGWDKKELVLFCSLWDESWEIPIDYNSFRFLHYEGEDYETWPAIDAALYQLELIIMQLRRENAEYRKKDEDNANN